MTSDADDDQRDAGHVRVADASRIAAALADAISWVDYGWTAPPD
jgi:hypothetical protein